MTVVAVPSAAFAENAVAAVDAPLSICSQPVMSTSVVPPLYSSTASATGVVPLSDDTSLMRTCVQSGAAGAKRLVPGDPMSPLAEAFDPSASPATESCHCDASFAPSAA